ncbi:RNA polymerase sigma factor [Streptacidiphilus sp. PAMC 29251]
MPSSTLTHALTRAEPAPGETYTGTPEQILAQVMQANGRRITAFIAFRLPHLDWQLAEDLAQEVFLHLWRWQITRGITLDDRVYGLLCCTARQAMAQHFRTKRNGERAVDFTDPALKPVTAAPQDTPHLARLYDELEAAKGALVPLAEAYRVVRRQIRDAKSALRFAALPATVERCSNGLAELAATEQAVVDALQAGADLVAAYRRAFDSAAATLGNADSDPDMDEALRRVRQGAGR